MPIGGGVAGAALLGLLDERDVRPRRRELLDLLGDLLGAVADDDARCAPGCSRSRAWMTCSTIARPQIRCSGLGRLGAHPRAFAGGEDDRGDTSCGPLMSTVRRR